MNDDEVLELLLARSDIKEAIVALDMLAEEVDPLGLLPSQQHDQAQAQVKAVADRFRGALERAERARRRRL